jgi:hypothetical protein
VNNIGPNNEGFDNIDLYFNPNRDTFVCVLGIDAEQVAGNRDVAFVSTDVRLGPHDGSSRCNILHERVADSDE